MQKILVIDDDQALADALTFGLLAEGFQVSKAPNGLPGLARAVATRPDLIVLDVSADTDGFTLAERLRGNPVTGSTPLVLMADGDRWAADRQAAAGHAVGLFQKPAGIEEIVACVVDCLGLERSTDETWRAN